MKEWRTLPPSDTIPTTILIAAEAFGSDLSAAAVAAALGVGLAHRQASLQFRVEHCPLDATLPADFERRLECAWALILATPAIDPQKLRETLSFEIATRARQGGIPAYAVLRQGLDLFDARILDLQSVQMAHDEHSLELAGTQLASLL